MGKYAIINIEAIQKRIEEIEMQQKKLIKDLKNLYDALGVNTNKYFSYPIVWQSYKRVPVQAENLEEAVKLALKQFLSEPDDLYIEDSFEIDEILGDEYPNEEFDLNKILQKI